MKIAIMQPYFLPYIGYFQLINAVDEFVIYDNIEFTKKGWINRNRILVNGRDAYITLPLKNDSDYLDVRERFLADGWDKDKVAMLNRISGAYRKSPNFEIVYSMLEKCVLFEERNLFKFILNSLNLVLEYLEIKTPVIISSAISINHELKSEKKVVALCLSRHATEYINPIGGVNLYKKDDFQREGIGLSFLKSNNFVYQQFGHEFVPWLSIIDVIMFNPREAIKSYLDSSYTLI